jgi:hypothetical protein
MQDIVAKPRQLLISTLGRRRNRMRFITLTVLSLLLVIGCSKRTPKGLKLGGMGAQVTNVIVVDFDQDPPKRYNLAVGETTNGITVVKADYRELTAVVRKDGQEYSLKMSSQPLPNKPLQATPQ